MCHTENKTSPLYDVTEKNATEREIKILIKNAFFDRINQNRQLFLSFMYAHMLFRKDDF